MTDSAVPMSLLVRRAENEDRYDLATMLRASREEKLDSRGGSLYANREGRREPFENSFVTDITSDDCAVWIGSIDEVLLGFATARRETLLNQDVHISITELYVDPEAREVGLGEEIMSVIIEWSKSISAKTIDALALPGDRNTKNFFEMSGFSARLLIMHHVISDDDE